MTPLHGFIIGPESIIKAMNQQNIILSGLSREELRADLREIVREEVAALPQLQKPKKYLTLEETAALTGMSKSKLYQLTSGRKIPFIKRYGKLLFSYEEVTQWMEEAKQPAIER